MRRFSLLLADLVALVVSSIVAVYLRENFALDGDRFESLLPYMAATLLSGTAVVQIFGLDRGLWRYSAMKDYLRAIVAVFVVVIGATVITFVATRMEGIARSIPILHALVGCCALVGLRVCARLYHADRDDPRPLFDESRASPEDDHVLIIGLSRLTDLYIKAVEEGKPAGLRLAGILDPTGPSQDYRHIHNLRVFGPSHSIASALSEVASHGMVVTRLVVTMPINRLPALIRSEVEAARQRGILIVTPLVEVLAGAPRASAQISQPLASPAGESVTGDRDAALLRLPPEVLAAIASRPYWAFKRTLDIVASALLLLLLAPVMTLIAAAVVASIGRPAIFWQMRPGRFGRRFKLYKFRTMTAPLDANGRPLSDQERLGRVGRFLRATRLDELPQLWNILGGTMSFIGPRPLLPVDQPASNSTRLLVKPGLTGWAQVHGGRHVQPVDKAALDIWYVMNASLWCDAQIAIQTVPVVLFGESVSAAAIEAAWTELRRAGTTNASSYARK